ncbi:hypothetical protein OE88DRAFT_1642594 [Heliocybe sulcata]|uniref:Uncharacterized protein n=1 Tax=Heliocybe sulcata TaxID=5364 RepID=A0A5C3NAN2_9AGAM|nr:hypothetical protein OE88DRAFT_1642594 [Heliocybe sulcata]
MSRGRASLLVSVGCDIHTWQLLILAANAGCGETMLGMLTDGAPLSTSLPRAREQATSFDKLFATFRKVVLCCLLLLKTRRLRATPSVPLSSRSRTSTTSLRLDASFGLTSTGAFSSDLPSLGHIISDSGSAGLCVADTARACNTSKEHDASLPRALSGYNLNVVNNPTRSSVIRQCWLLFDVWVRRPEKDLHWSAWIHLAQLVPTIIYHVGWTIGLDLTSLLALEALQDRFVLGTDYLPRTAPIWLDVAALVHLAFSWSPIAAICSEILAVTPS